MSQAPARTQPAAVPALDWGDWRTPFLFFTGKGGVGKTTVASAVAVTLADAGRRVLVVSTDPASNLGDVFGMAVAPEPRGVPGVAGLEVMNLDPDAAAAAYRERVIAPYRGSVPTRSWAASKSSSLVNARSRWRPSTTSRS
jgi:arsenite-transporting ATPase